MFGINSWVKKVLKNFANYFSVFTDKQFFLLILLCIIIFFFLFKKSVSVIRDIQIAKGPLGLRLY